MGNVYLNKKENYHCGIIFKLFHKLILIIIPTLLILSFNFCEDGYNCDGDCDEDCDDLILTKTELSGASYDRFYLEKICYDWTHISNLDTYDDFAIYYEYSIAGDLPKGVTYSEDWGCLQFHGTPKEKGAFIFNIVLTVRIETATIKDDPFNNDEIDPFEDKEYEWSAHCENTIWQSFVIIVR